MGDPRRADGVVVHSRFDLAVLRQTYALDGVPAQIALHGPYDHHETTRRPPAERGRRLLFFGTIRPYKGLEDLIEAFGRLPGDYHLTVVGETWQEWTQPVSMIAASPAADRITLVNRYVADAEVDRVFAGADVVVLPYRRSSASGPLHIAMSHGLPVVVTSVGGLVEAAEQYSGTVFVPAAAPVALAAGIERAVGLAGRRHADPSSWEHTVSAYSRLLSEIGVPVTSGVDQELASATSSNQIVPLLSPDLR